MNRLASRHDLRAGSVIPVGACDAEVVSASPGPGRVSVKYRYLNGHLKGRLGYETFDADPVACPRCQGPGFGMCPCCGTLWPETAP